MSVVHFPIRQSDTLPKIAVIARDALDAPVDLTNATAVEFTMRSRSTGALKVDAATATLLDQTTTPGGVEYQLADADRDTPDSYRAYFRVRFPGNAAISFPDEDDRRIELRVTVYPD
jgi:hypothetical protein